MVLVEWETRFALGVTQIDEHHEQLVNLLNECYRALMLHDHHQELKAIVSQLRDYTLYHFEAEKKLMDQFGYPQAAAHLAAHETFTNSILEFQGRLQKGESLVAMDLLAYLKEWLLQHIQKTDRAFADFLQEKREQQ